MHLFSITLKNYRCFEDTDPLRIEIGQSFTALVGSNNSGKSSVLRFFYEMRSLFIELQKVSAWIDLINGRSISVRMAGVEDATEIFCNRNQRSLTVELDFPIIYPEQLVTLRLTAARPTPIEQQNVTFQGEALYAGAQNIPEKVLPGPNTSLQDGILGPFTSQIGSTVSVNVRPLIEMCQSLVKSIYIGPFRSILTEAGGTHYDLIVGTAFVAAWDTWKTGSNRSQNITAQRITEDIARIFGYKHLDIDTADNHLTLHIVADGNPLRLRELGAGLAQFIIVLANVAMKRPAFIFIDEPELNLHPALQADFLTSLVSYSSHGVIFATHSVGLARTTAERIYSFRQNNGKVTAHSFEQTPNFAEFVGEMSFSAFKELGCETILLVEGITDVKAVQQLLRAMGKDHKVVVIPLGGRQFIRGGVQIELAELNRLSNNVAVVIDSELNSPTDTLSSQRSAFIEECKALGFSICVMKYRAFENYLSEQAIQAVKGPKYQALGPYELLKDAPNGWAKEENWRIAREMTLTEIEATDLGQFLAKLG